MKWRSLACLALLALMTPQLIPTSAAQPGPNCFGQAATIVGTEGRDRLTGTPRADVIVGRGGGDRISGRGGNDRICGGNGFDRLDGGAGWDRVKGNAGPDDISGGLGKDLIASGKGSFHDIVPGRGDDRVVGGPGFADLVDLGDSTRAVDVDLTAGTARGQGTDRLRRIEDVSGTRFDDTLRGNAGPNFLSGRGGDDEISGLQDPPGLGWVDWLSGGSGDDTMDGGDGSDVVTFAPANRAVTVDLEAQTASGEGNDTFTSIEDAEGSRFNDNLIGDNNDNIFSGRQGDDVIDGAGGFDTIAFLFARRGIAVDLAAETARGVGADTLTNIEDIWGSGFRDTLRGDARPNFIRGGPGNDVIAGRRGNDRLLGGPQRDRVRGGAGTDVCAGERERGCETNPGGGGRVAGTTGSALWHKEALARRTE